MTAAPAPSLLPFSIIDETIALLDAEAAPWSIQLEARVAGRLDEQRLRAAVHAGLLRHPLAHARKVPAKPSARVSCWEPTDVLELDPLRVVDCADWPALARVRDELQSRRVPLVESPPLRLRLARHPEGDVLMINANHVAFDGFGVLRVLRSVARAYTGEADPLPAVDLLATRDAKALFAAADRRNRWARYGQLLEKLRDLVGAPARLAADGGSDRSGYGFHHLRLPADATAALLGADRGDATVNDVLLAALMTAIERWNTDHGRRTGRIGVLVPVNLWPDRPDDLVGNFTLPVRVSAAPDRHDDPESLLAAVAARTRAVKQRGTGPALVEVLDGVARLPLWAKTVASAILWVGGNRLVDTAMLSNLGRLDDLPDFGPDAGPTTELWFSPPVRLPLGLAVGAATAAGRLHLSLRYRHPVFGAAAIERFAALYEHCLLRYADS